MVKFTPRALAVQAVTLSSATLSATYYATVAPQATFAVHGVNVAPWVIFFAGTAFALDSAKPLMMKVAGTPKRGAIRRVAAFLTFLVLFMGSMIAIDGVLMKLRSDWAADRGGAIGNFQEAKKAVEELEAELAAVGPSRSVDEIQAQIDAHPIDMAVCGDGRSPARKSRATTRNCSVSRSSSSTKSAGARRGERSWSPNSRRRGQRLQGWTRRSLLIRRRKRGRRQPGGTRPSLPTRWCPCLASPSRSSPASDCGS